MNKPEIEEEVELADIVSEEYAEECDRQVDLAAVQQDRAQIGTSRCARTYQARELLEKWKPAAEKMKELLEDSRKMKETGSWGSGFKIDKACIPLCNVMNLLPGTKTNSSCQGHGKQFFFV